MLHDGPVRAGLDTAALATERASFLAARFGLEPAEPLRQFTERDAALAAALARGDGIILWFEHDLYDQLQLVQILDRLPAGTSARLAQADDYLSRMQPEALAASGEAAPPVTPAQHGLARAAWSAFTAPTPEPLAALLGQGLTALPWLRPALVRLLEELPAPGSGLSRTERQALEPLAAGELHPEELYRRARTQDEPWFMGDWPFFVILDELAAAPTPLIEGLPVGGYPFQGMQADRLAYLAAKVRLTASGTAALAGRLDRATAKPLDRWLGGTRLGPAAVWRWDTAATRLERDAARLV